MEFILIIFHSIIELNLDAYLDFDGIHSKTIQSPYCITHGTYFHVYSLMTLLVRRNFYSLPSVNAYIYVDGFHPSIPPIFFMHCIWIFPTHIPNKNTVHKDCNSSPKPHMKTTCTFTLCWLWRSAPHVGSSTLASQVAQRRL